MRRIWILVPFFYLFAIPAMATGPVVTGVTGASNYNLSATPPAIYGGTASGGNATPVNPGTGEPANTCQSQYLTCATHPLCACNTAEIYDGLALTITATANSGSTGALAATYGTNSTLTPLGTPTSTTISFDWQTICEAIAPGKTCAQISASDPHSVTVNLYNSDSTSATSQIQISVFAPGQNFNVYDSTGTLGAAEGIYDFLPYPGDGQIYLEGTGVRTPQATSSFPNMSYGGAVTAVRVFVSSKSEDEAAYGSYDSTADLQMVGGGSSDLQSNVVSGLTNNQLYFFRVALVDQANNVVQFFPASPDLNSPPAGTLADCTTAPTSNCYWSSTPSQVLGLLTKDLNCFITTAAYGSEWAPKVQTFREFRNLILLRHSWGVWLDEQYYHYGPYGAQFIYNKPTVRAIVRAFLWPFYLFSVLALKVGLTMSLIVSFLLSGFVMTTAWLAIRRVAARE